MNDSDTPQPTGFDSRPDTWEHINRVQQLMAIPITELIGRGIVHDASKLISPEVEKLDETTPLLKDLTYGTPEYRASLAYMNEAIEHHYSLNSHHPQFYGEHGVNGMDLMDLIEMLCDWKAASERGKGNDFMAGLAHNKERYALSDQLYDILVNTALRLGYDTRN